MQDKEPIMWYHRGTLIAILGIAFVLRVQGIHARCLWFDEALSWRFIQFPLPTMMDRIGEPTESNPPLYYLALRGWALIWGDSAGAMRSLALLCGVITVWAVYQLVLELALLNHPSEANAARARMAALTAAALVALSPIQVHASQQARMYAMGTALLTISCWLLVRAVRMPDTRYIYWMLFGLTAVLSCYTHYMALLTVAGAVLFAACYLMLGDVEAKVNPEPPSAPIGAFLKNSRSLLRTFLWNPRRNGFIAALGLIGVGCIPVVAMAISKGQATAHSMPLGWQSLPHESALSLVSTFAAPDQASPILEWVVTIGLFYVLIRHLFCGGWPGRFAAATGLLPVLLMMADSISSGRSIYYSRYLTFIHVMWMASIALYLSGLKRMVRWPLTATIVLGWTFFSYPVNWEIVGPTSKPGMKDAVEYVLSHRNAEEPLIVQRPITLIKARYYLRERVPALLCVTIPSRHFQTQAPWLDDEELISTEDVLALDAPAAWVLSTSWYDETRNVTFPLPGHWRLDETRVFPQDYPGEGPVIVYYYRVAR